MEAALSPDEAGCEAESPERLRQSKGTEAPHVHSRDDQKIKPAL
jgi:hypothetical protein